MDKQNDNFDFRKVETIELGSKNKNKKRGVTNWRPLPRKYSYFKCLMKSNYFLMILATEVPSALATFTT